MFKKWNEFISQKTKQWSQEKFLFVFVKLPMIILSIYCVLITGAFLWSFTQNMKVVRDFKAVEESCDRLLEQQRNTQRYQKQYRSQQLQQQRYQQAEPSALKIKR